MSQVLLATLCQKLSWPHTFNRRMCRCSAGKQRGRGHRHRLAPSQLQLLLVQQHAIQLLLRPSSRPTGLQLATKETVKQGSHGAVIAAC